MRFREVMYAQLVEDVVEALTAREGDAGDGRGSGMNIRMATSIHIRN